MVQPNQTRLATVTVMQTSEEPRRDPATPAVQKAAQTRHFGVGLALTPTTAGLLVAVTDYHLSDVIIPWDLLRELLASAGATREPAPDDATGRAPSSDSARETDGGDP